MTHRARPPGVAALLAAALLAAPASGAGAAVVRFPALMETGAPRAGGWAWLGHGGRHAAWTIHTGRLPEARRACVRLSLTVAGGGAPARVGVSVRALTGERLARAVVAAGRAAATVCATAILRAVAVDAGLVVRVAWDARLSGGRPVGVRRRAVALVVTPAPARPGPRVVVDGDRTHCRSTGAGVAWRVTLRNLGDAPGPASTTPVVHWSGGGRTAFPGLGSAVTVPAGGQVDLSAHLPVAPGARPARCGVLLGGREWPVWLLVT